MDYKTFQPMELLKRDEARDIGRIRESLETFVDSYDREINLQPEVNIDFNPEINVDIDTEGIEDGLASISTDLAELNSLQQVAIEVNRSGFSTISTALQGIKKVGALWMLDGSFRNPELYRAKYLELLLDNVVPSSGVLANMLYTGHVYTKLYALTEMAEQRVYTPEVFTALVGGNAVMAAYAAYALPRINPPLIWKGQAIQADSGRYVYGAPANSPAFDYFTLALANKDATARSRTAKVLGMLTDGGVFWPSLLEIAAADEPKVRKSAERSLIRFGRRILPDLEKMLKALSPNDKKFKLGRTVRDSILQRYTSSPSTYLEVYRSDILGNNLPALTSLGELVQKGGFYEKLYALAELGSQRKYDDSIVAALASRNKTILRYVSYALAEIQPLVFSKGTKVIMSSDTDQNLKKYVSPPHYTYQQDAWSCYWEAVALVNSPAFDALTYLLQNKDAEVRGKAVCALRRLPGGYSAWWELLLVYCYDQDKRVRNTASRTLQDFGKDVIEQVEYMLKVDGIDPRLSRAAKKIRDKIKL